MDRLVVLHGDDTAESGLSRLIVVGKVWLEAILFFGDATESSL